jgi:type I restriction enzyme M protein
LHSVTAEDEWLCEAYLETDYSTITQADFERDVMRFALYNLMLEIQSPGSSEALHDKA